MKKKRTEYALKKVVNIVNLKEATSAKRDLAYWLSKTPGERVSAVDFLRRQYYGTSDRLQRSARIVQRSRD